MNPFKFLFHLVTLGMFRKFKGARVQSGIRRAVIEVVLPKWGCPTKDGMLSFLHHWFSEEEANHAMYLMTNGRFTTLYFETEKDASTFINHLVDLVDSDNVGFPPIKLTPGYVFLGDRGYTNVESLCWCKECKAVTVMSVADIFSEDDSGAECGQCESSDILPFDDMKPKEVEKHVKKAAA